MPGHCCGSTGEWGSGRHIDGAVGVSVRYLHVVVVRWCSEAVQVGGWGGYENMSTTSLRKGDKKSLSIFYIVGIRSERVGKVIICHDRYDFEWKYPKSRLPKHKLLGVRYQILSVMYQVHPSHVDSPP